MLRSKVETYKYRVGKNTYIVININQLAAANAEQGNVLASNALNVQILKKSKRKRR
ncbi:hypothetical protein [Paenibacillus prosopidis]|uniref:Uncharacterized protein n=1 Tax=Paenibacillus prosopidis TaxID=630520 RepID=A0A368W5G6_9BACL|nr:hypothetical protein [Paenibacillus prosopidis]RCW48993.1 hypothetical protein DFP97_105178 [Paenibacillus prosopidis]